MTIGIKTIVEKESALEATLSEAKQNNFLPLAAGNTSLMSSAYDRKNSQQS